MAEKGLKQNELASFSGISTSAVSAWNKKNLNPAAEKLSIIADFLNVSLEYLITGKDSVKNTNLSDDEIKLLEYYKGFDECNKCRILERAETLSELDAEEKAKKETEKTKKKPPLKFPLPPQEVMDAMDSTNFTNYGVVGLYIAEYDSPVSAGNGIEIDDAQAEPIFIEDSDEARRADFVLSVKGDSMEPIYYDGDRVAVEKSDFIEVGEIGIFVYEGDVFIKKRGNGELISLNKKYPPIKILNYDSFFHKGKVIGKVEVVNNQEGQHKK
ncbi:MAG: XRE family transcriptional regulator [Oscillospiraceae bacterium]|nr:XRE family transcriptional regulator [Oscillospiraceae bacterium]